MHNVDDASYMRLALQMAAQAKGQTGANPVVGCVIVKDGRIIGLGSHLKYGEAHAEAHALNMAGDEAAGSTVYVTLEPCSHTGKTPPCAQRLLDAQVSRVVIACLDPHEQVAGAGKALLEEHGIQVEVGLCRQEALQLNEHFFKYITKRLPFVTLKTASTMDGKIATKTGDSKWITGGQAREYVHTLRHQHDAIMVGVNTVIADDPQLSTRLSVPAIQPVRVIIDANLRTPPEAQVVQSIKSSKQRTIIFTTNQATEEKQTALQNHGVEVIRTGDGPKVDVQRAMQYLAEQGISSVLLEGGGQLNGAMLEAKLIDKILLFIAPKIVGGKEAPPSFNFSGFERMDEAIMLERMSFESYGNDICISGYPVYTRKSDNV